jgi:dephospho-CoA kinase
MRILGITGGIAGGKSFVAEFFRQRGLPVLDADQIARELCRPGAPLLATIAASFGPQYLAPGGQLDRKKLGQLIFSDAEARARLDRLCHPPILAELEARLQALRASPRPPALAVVVAPLLFEAGARHLVDKVLLVAAEEKERLRRLQEREGLTREQARQRLASQMPFAAQKPLADWVIDTTPGKEATLARLEALLPELLQ